MWINGSLTTTQRNNLRHGDGIKYWEKYLSAAFKQSMTEAKKTLENTRYSIREIRRGDDVAAYVQTIMHACEAIDMKGIDQQLTYAWNNLHPVIKVTTQPHKKG